MSELNITNQHEKQRQRIKNAFLRNFMMGSSALVVTGVVVPQILQKPQADIITLFNRGTTIDYEVNVRDPNNRLAPDSLKLELVSYNDKQYFDLDLGWNSNSVSNLTYDQRYTLKVVGDYGFGTGSLVEKSIRISKALQAGFKQASYGLDNVFGEFYVSDDEEKITNNLLYLGLYQGSSLLETQTFTLVDDLDPNTPRYQAFNFSFTVADTTEPYTLKAQYNVANYPITIAEKTLDPGVYLPMVDIFAESYMGGTYVSASVNDFRMQYVNPVFRLELLALDLNRKVLFSQDYPQTSGQQYENYYYLSAEITQVLEPGNYRVNVYLIKRNSTQLLGQKDFVPGEGHGQYYYPNAMFNITNFESNLSAAIQIDDYEAKLLATQVFHLRVEASSTSLSVHESDYTLIFMNFR